MTIPQLYALEKELSDFRDHLREIPGQVDMPHVLAAACHIAAGQIDKLIRHVGHEIECQEVTAIVMENRNGNRNHLR